MCKERDFRGGGYGCGWWEGSVWRGCFESGVGADIDAGLVSVGDEDRGGDWDGDMDRDKEVGLDEGGVFSISSPRVVVVGLGRAGGGG